jgi:hypothetical protein
MTRELTPRSTLENLKREAKRWLDALREDVADARSRFARAFPDGPRVPTLRDVQHALAREHGFPGWTALRDKLAALSASAESPRAIEFYERAAADLLEAYRTGSPRALASVWEHAGHRRSLDAMRRYIRVDLGYRETDDVDISLDEARRLVARGYGFDDWQTLTTHLASLRPDRTTIASHPVRAFSIDANGDHQTVAATRDWDEILERLESDEIPGLNAEGEMTDALLERVSRLDHLTSLDLGGSKRLTTAGFRHLERMTQLRELELSGTSFGDRDLAVVRQLPHLETIRLNGTQVTDAGMPHLSACDELRRVELGGTRTGDGAIRALAGKAKLAVFRSGEFVTDGGLPHLRDLPVFNTWLGGDVSMGLTAFEARPNYLLLRGSFTDRGVPALAALDGLFALNIDNAHLPVTGAGLAPLVDLPHLGWLAFDAKDDAMPWIAAMPRLRFLMCQDTSAGDDGFVALSRSRSIEYIWGRRCHNLRSRGFAALADMPALRALSVSCKNVGDDALAALPRFPALEELMPMDVPDDGYRHIGRCERLQSLVLMYCRDTTDVATGHLSGLPRLKKYFASYTQITDRTPEILAGISSLEQVTFSACARLTNAGITALARLPRLREVDVGGMPNVTSAVVTGFPPAVQVKYSP